MRIRDEVNVGKLRHQSVMKGVSLVVILSLVLAIVVPSQVIPLCCMGFGALLSYAASVLFFEI